MKKSLRERVKVLESKCENLKKEIDILTRGMGLFNIYNEGPIVVEIEKNSLTWLTGEEGTKIIAYWWDNEKGELDCNYCHTNWPSEVVKVNKTCTKMNAGRWVIKLVLECKENKVATKTFLLDIEEKQMVEYRIEDLIKGEGL